MTDRTMLVVEDNPGDLELMMIAFKMIEFPYKVVVTRDGVEALDYLLGCGNHDGRPKSDPPVLVLMDLKMPRMNGFEVLKTMREDPALKSIPVVMLTSSVEDADRTKAMKYGADLYLQKAVDFNEFMVMLRQIEALIASVIAKS